MNIKKWETCSVCGFQIGSIEHKEQCKDEAGTFKLAPIGADVNSANDIGTSEKPVTVVQVRESRPPRSVCGVIPQGASYSQKYFKILKILRKYAEEFRPDFYQWIIFNYHVYTEFEQRALLVARNRSHYSARTIMEVIRHDTIIGELTGIFKINNNFTPDCARLFAIQYPGYAELFEYRVHRAADGVTVECPDCGEKITVPKNWKYDIGCNCGAEVKVSIAEGK